MTDTNTAAALSAEADGWIEWSGGPTPQGYGQRRTRNYESGVKSFDDDDWGSDIIAYRVATPAPAALEGSSLGEADQVEMIADLIEKHTYVMSKHNPAMARVAGHNATATAILRTLQPSSAADAKPVAETDELHGQDYINTIKAHRIEHGSSLAVARDAVDQGWRPKAQPQPSQQAGATNEQVAALSKHLRESCGLTTTAGVLTEAVRLVNLAATTSQQAGEYDESDALTVAMIIRRDYFVSLNSSSDNADEVSRAILAALKPVEG